MSKEAAMSELKARAAEVAQQVCEHGRVVVWGEGSFDAKVAVVGEAPGDREEKLARPFVGPAGRLLDRELERAGLSRGSVWITNVVKCRPTRQVGGRTANRPPTVKEASAWLGLLTEELEIVSPAIIVCMGAVAASYLIHSDFALTRERGRWFDGPLGTRAIATFHPAYILRQLGQDWELAMEAFRSDLQQVADAVK